MGCYFNPEPNVWELETWESRRIKERICSLLHKIKQNKLNKVWSLKKLILDEQELEILQKRIKKSKEI